MRWYRTAILLFVVSVLLFSGCGEKKTAKDTSTIPDSAAGMVDDMIIDWGRYQSNVNQAIEYERVLGDLRTLTPSIERHISEEIFQEMIEAALLDRWLRDHGVPVEQADLAEAVENNPPPIQVLQNRRFQDSSGKFNKQTYVTFYNDLKNRAVVGRIEQLIMLILQRERVQTELAQSIPQDEASAKAEYVKQNRRGQASYLWIPFYEMEVDASALTDEMLRAYFQQHLEEFRFGPRRRVNVVVFEDKPSESMRTAAFHKIETLQNRLNRGEDFARLATVESNDPTKARGGLIGWVKRGWLMPELEDAAFNGKVGDVVGPVETQMGYHLVKIEGRRGNGPSEEVNIRHILVAILQQPSDPAKLEASAESFRKDAARMGMTNAARMYSVKVDAIDALDDSGQIPGFGYKKELADFLLSAPLRTISAPQRFGNKFGVFEAVGDIPEEMQTFEQAKEALRERLLYRKQQERARQVALDLREELVRGNAMESIAKEKDIQFISSRSWISRSANGSGLEGDSVFVKTVLSLSPGECSDPIQVNNGFIIVRLDKLDDPDPGEWERHKAIYMEQRVQQKRQQVYTDWLNEQRREADIKDLRARFE